MIQDIVVAFRVLRKRPGASAVVVLTLTGGAAAGPFEDGLAAAKLGDHETAHELWLPLS